MSQSAPLVSVIIPCYKQAHFLGEAIESVLAQTYSNVEIVVIDDGSPDDPSAVVARYSAVRFMQQPNQGVSTARNNGLAASTGDYVVFLDADDLMLPEAVAAGVEALSAHPECAFVFGNFEVVDADRSPLPAWQQPSAEGDAYLALLRRNYVAMLSAVMFRRDILNEVGGFDASLGAFEDYELYLRIARSHPIHYHGKLLTEYRRHGTNITGNPVWMIDAVRTVYRRQAPYVRGRREYEQACRAGRRHYQWRFGERLVEQIRARVRERDGWSPVLRDVSALLWYYPHGFARHAYRKIYCSLTGSPE